MSVPVYYYACFFTTYIFLAAVAVGTGLVRASQMPPMALEILRGAVWIVAVSVVYIYVRFGFSAIQEFYIKLGLNPDWTLVYDTIVHFAPVVWVGGLPRTALGFVGGYVLFLGWFGVIRATIGLPRLYVSSLSTNAYDQWAAVYLPIVLAISFGITLGTQTMLKNDTGTRV